MTAYDSGPSISRLPGEDITPPDGSKLPNLARLFVKLNDADRIVLATAAGPSDGVVEHAGLYTGNDFDDDGVRMQYDGFPLVRISEDVDVDDELTPAAGDTGMAAVAVATNTVVAIAKTAGLAASDFPFVRVQMLRRGQYAKA